MVTLYVKAEGQDVIMNVIASMAARGVNTRPLMGTLGHVILSSVTRNFEEEGRPRWKPISDMTEEIYSGKLIDRLFATKGYQNLKRKQTRIEHQRAYVAQHGGRKILQGEGDLKKSVVIGNITNSSVEIGSSLPYARIHQLGGEIRPKNGRSLMVPMGLGNFMLLKKVTIPARPYLLLQKEDETVILRATKDYIADAAVHADVKGNRFWR